MTHRTFTLVAALATLAACETHTTSAPSTDAGTPPDASPSDAGVSLGCERSLDFAPSNVDRSKLPATSGLARAGIAVTSDDCVADTEAGTLSCADDAPAFAFEK